MRKISILLFSLILAACVGAQESPAVAPPASTTVTLTLTVTVPATTPEGDLVYLAGNFNNWTPGDPANALTKDEKGIWHGTFVFPQGYTLECKFTHGGWDKVEKDEAGHEIANRGWIADKSASLTATVGAWADQISTVPAASSVTGIVDLVDVFPLPPAGGKRLLRVRLPDGYATSGQNYRVLYMMDGQNLFDDATSFVGEWKVDETLTTLESQGLVEPTIVVGIDNAGAGRQNEYSPYFDAASPLPGGQAFADWVVKSLKPWVDTEYRTLPDSAHTAIAGSSMGGLISVYTALRHPGIFGQVASFSGAFWFGNTGLAKEIRTTPFDSAARVYLDVGTAEIGSADDNDKMAQDSREMAQVLLSSGLAQDHLKLLIVPGAKHNEGAWSVRLGPALLWLFQGVKP